MRSVFASQATCLASMVIVNLNALVTTVPGMEHATLFTVVQVNFLSTVYCEQMIMETKLVTILQRQSTNSTQTPVLTMH